MIESNQENFTSLEKPVDNKEENEANKVEGEITTQIDNLQNTAADIKVEIEKLGGAAGFDKALEGGDKEEAKSIYKKAKNIIILVSGLIAIPTIATMINPELAQTVSDFLNNATSETAVVGACAAATIAFIALAFSGKDGLKVKDILENESITEKNYGEDGKFNKHNYTKKELHERFIKRNFGE